MDIEEFKERISKHMEVWTQEQTMFVVLCAYDKLDDAHREWLMQCILKKEDERIEEILREFEGIKQ